MRKSDLRARCGFGGVIAQLRIARRLTQTELANLAGISMPSVQKIEANPQYKIRWGTFVKIADALGKTTDEIWQLWRGSADTQLLVVSMERETLKRVEKQARKEGVDLDVWISNTLRDAVGLEPRPEVGTGVVVVDGKSYQVRNDRRPGMRRHQITRGD